MGLDLSKFSKEIQNKIQLSGKYREQHIQTDSDNTKQDSPAVFRLFMNWMNDNIVILCLFHWFTSFSIISRIPTNSTNMIPQSSNFVNRIFIFHSLKIQLHIDFFRQLCYNIRNYQ